MLKAINVLSRVRAIVERPANFGLRWATTLQTPVAEPLVTAEHNNQDESHASEADENLDWVLKSEEYERSADRAAHLSRSAPTSDANEPLYLPLSSLLVRKPGEPRPARQVIALAPSVFDHPIRRDILHSCVVHHLDSLRQGTAKTKNRGEVNGSGRKLRRQKGTGQARLGDRGSPMLRGGGRAFGPVPRDFSTKLPRKVREMGMRVALSTKIRERSFEVVSTLRWPTTKTNELWKRLRTRGWSDRTLFVVGGDKIPRGLQLASRNIKGVDIFLAKDLTVYDALKWRRLILDVEAVGYFAEWLAKDGDAAEDSTTFVTSAVPPPQRVQAPSIMRAPKSSVIVQSTN